MSKQRRIAYVLIGVLGVLVLLAVPASWTMSALGFDVNNLISSEGLRWCFRLSLDSFSTHRLELLWMFLTVVGAWQYSGLSAETVSFLRRGRSQHRRALSSSIALLLAMLALLVLLLLPSSAPLRSATGRVWPSPFWLGIIRALSFALWLTAACFGVASGLLRGAGQWLRLSYVGLVRYAPWLIVWLLAEMLWQQLQFIIHHAF